MIITAPLKGLSTDIMFNLRADAIAVYAGKIITSPLVPFSTKKGEVTNVALSF